MRRDMSRKVIERPRTKGSGKTYIRKLRRNKDYENLPSKQTPRATHRVGAGYDWKELTDKLNPLFRYLDKQIGRPWNKVQSEMMEVLDTRDPIQNHIFEHVDQHIAINVQEAPLHESKTGLIYHYTFSNSWYDTRMSVRENQLYVCPKSGIIKRAKLKVKRQKIKKESSLRKIDDNHIATKLKGIWYTVELAKFTKYRVWKWYEHAIEDGRSYPMNEGKVSLGYYRDYYTVNGETKSHVISADKDLGIENWWGVPKELRFLREMVCVKRTQMNSKQLRSLNLKND